MSFLRDVQLHNGTNVSNNNISFLDTTIIPEDQTRSNKLVEMRNEAKQLELESKKVNSVGGLIKGTSVELGKKTIEAGKVAIKTLWDTYNETPRKIIDDIEGASGDISQGREFTGVLKSGGRTAGDVAIALFAPISAAIGGILSLTGGDKLIDHTGQVIADKSGITDLPAFQKFAMQHPNAAEDFNRLLMLSMAGLEKGRIEPKRMLSETKSYAESILNHARIIEQPKQVITPKTEQVINKTPAEKHTEYAKSQGYEPYTPTSELPVIDMGKPAKDSLPSIQVGESVKVTKNKSGEYTYEPIKETKVEPIPKPEFVSQRPRGFIETTVPPTGKTFEIKKPTISISEIKVSKLSRDIQEKINQDFGDLPEYKVMNMADQAQKALKIVSDNPEQAKNIALGNEKAPGDIREGSIFVALREKAYKEGDVQMLLDLSKSSLANEASALGQRIKAYDASEIVNDPVKIIKKIEFSNKETFEKRTGKKVSKIKKESIKEIKTEIKKTAPTKQSWSEFIESIKCK